jgi:antitoxin component YwqK of YwqJK toxin-antitoxin module
VSGRLNLEINFKDGEENGLMKMWFENGQLKQELNIKNGKKDGLYKLWHENGHLIEEGNFKDGEKNGLFKTWFEDGKLNTVFYMKGNKRHGLDKSYIDGKLISEGNMNDGKLDGIWKYYRRGEVIYEGTYEENNPIKESGDIFMGSIMKLERMSKDSITMEELKAMRDKIKCEKESNIFWRAVGEQFGN